MNAKIFGERNCSTNALRKLIELNSTSRVIPSMATELSRLHALTLRPLTFMAEKVGFNRRIIREKLTDRVFADRPDLDAWKHCLTDFSSTKAFEGHMVIFCIRHPASWLLSLHSRPHHALSSVPENFVDFLSSEWKTVARERMDCRSLDPVSLYHAKIRAYLGFAGKIDAAGIPSHFVRFEDFASDQLVALAKIAPHLDNFATVPAYIEEGTKDPQKSRDYYRDYYGNERWREKITPETAELLRTRIDWGLFEQWGYRSV